MSNSMEEKHWNMMVTATHEARNFLSRCGQLNESANNALGVYLVCLATHLERDNPNFNMQKFLKMAGVSSYDKTKALPNRTR